LSLSAQVSRTLPAEDNRLPYAIGISILLHLVFVWLVKLPPAIKQPEERLIEVSLQAPTEKSKKLEENLPVLKNQVITPPDLEESLTPPIKTNFLSDKNTITPKEQIKRGDGVTKKSEPVKNTNLNRSNTIEKNNSKTELAKEKVEEVLDPKKLVNLKLSSIALEKITKPPSENEQPTKTRNLEQYQPFSKDFSANAELFRFRPGSSDYLSNIPDGDLTLLNAKADKFAPFVRRVASQVFGIVRRLQWHNMPKSDVLRINEFTTVEAVLSPNGKLIQVKFQESSGSGAFDNIITESVRQGASDQNPPAGVLAEDGKIHFIFKSRCWTRPGPAGIPDARWLLLSTGLL